MHPILLINKPSPPTERLPRSSPLLLRVIPVILARVSSSPPPTPPGRGPLQRSPRPLHRCRGRCLSGYHHWPTSVRHAGAGPVPEAWRARCTTSQFAARLMKTALRNSRAATRPPGCRVIAAVAPCGTSDVIAHCSVTSLGS